MLLQGLRLFTIRLFLFSICCHNFLKADLNTPPQKTQSQKLLSQQEPSLQKASVEKSQKLILQTLDQEAGGSDEFSKLPEGWESYLARPDILKIEAQSHDLEPYWEKIKKAHFSFIASLLAFYDQQTHFYFVARDSEYLYDTARLVTENTQNSSRIHLLNISRSNMEDPFLKEYLGEKGISDEALMSGKKILLIDTGFSGTIREVILDQLSSKSKNRVKAQLVVSTNSEHPSSRVFLVHMNPLINRNEPSSMYSEINDYEAIARFTSRSQKFLKIGNRYHPLSPKKRGGYSSDDGYVSKQMSYQYMQDLKSYWQNSKIQEEFLKEYKKLLKLRQALDSEYSEEIIAKELEKVHTTKEKNIFEAYVRDLIEVGQKNLESKKLNLEKIGLLPNSPAFILLEDLLESKKKNLLEQDLQKWDSFFRDPQTHIAYLFQTQQWSHLYEIMDARLGSEINKILAEFLFDEQEFSKEKYKFQKIFVQKATQLDLQDLAYHLVSQGINLKSSGFISLVSQKGEQGVLKWLHHQLPGSNEVSLYTESEGKPLSQLPDQEAKPPWSQGQNQSSPSTSPSTCSHVWVTL
jgi:hypothetical protein